MIYHKHFAMEIDVNGIVSNSTRSRHETMNLEHDCGYSSPRTFNMNSIYQLEIHVQRLYDAY